MHTIIRPSVTNIPSAASTKRWLGVGLSFCVALLVLVRFVLVFRSGLATILALAIALVLVLSLILFVPLVNRLSAKNATIFVCGDTLGTTTLTGKRRVFQTSDLSRIVLRSVTSGGVATAYTIFVSRAGRCLFKVASRQWDVNDLRRVCDACSVPLMGSWDEVASPARVNADIPGSFARWITILGK